MWGEDLILTNDVLRKNEQARSLSFLEVLELHITDLVEIVSRSPAARAQLKLAQVKLAVNRAFVLIAKAIKDVKKQYKLDVHKFDDEALKLMYEHILQGQFEPRKARGYQRVLSKPELPKTDEDSPTASPAAEYGMNASAREGPTPEKIWAYMDQLNKKLDRLLPVEGF
eukprot:gnl/TRDRNA2_/TRDRNA2_55855_c0_seq1.p1 gnl/TRDRNA2_/TRDRNA2_55855_c0~~gnl/TRDRNA2_/TRDRNA2_55855_c0_seq1.p1  ORF type:complete len:178 (-),score=36.58 gnl/TRDRNA2_/TRDRNA2_55855_c0_seq1:131-637(-)